MSIKDKNLSTKIGTCIRALLVILLHEKIKFSFYVFFAIQWANMLKKRPKIKGVAFFHPISLAAACKKICFLFFAFISSSEALIALLTADLKSTGFQAKKC